MGKYEGASRVALKPKTTEQAAALLRHCNERRLAVVPQASSHDICSCCSHACCGGQQVPALPEPSAARP